jgi:dTDP-N-acetylfucosamine:lipid II N-acetylfucosaminyltransferase
MVSTKISILHLASDEKFIEAANYIFEKAFPGCNHFIIPRSRFNRKFRHVVKKENVEVVPFGKDLIKLLSERTHHYNCVLLHGISDLNSNVFLSVNEKNKFIGILWGAELYTKDNFSERNLIGELTAKIELPVPEKSFRDKIKDVLKRILYSKSEINLNAIKSATFQLPYFGILYKEEFDNFMKRKLISENCRFISFTYYPLEFIMKGNESAIVNGNDILLGNSASLTNNHLEAFEIIKRMEIGTRKVVVPLSYGNIMYADYIQSKAIEHLNGNFKPLRKIMPLDEYNKVLQGCGIVIFNHYRQQAVGNILAVLWLGSKVYLNESNTIFSYLKRIGIFVYSIEKDFVPENEFALFNLTNTEIEHNRGILKKEIGEKQVIERLKKGIQDFFQNEYNASPS